MPKGQIQKSDPKLRAIVVCDDDDTLIRLRDYLARAGVETQATRRLADAWENHASQSIVLLPDDFDEGEVTDGLCSRILRVPSPLFIIVTAGPRLFEPVLESLGHPASIVIMPKPVLGWTILDLLRQKCRERA